MAMSDLPMPDVPGTVPNGAGSHAMAIGAFAISLAGYIPYLFAALPAIYYVILIYESKTVQGWLAKRRERKAKLNAAKLQAVAVVTEAKGDAATLVANTAAAVAKDELKK